MNCIKFYFIAWDNFKRVDACWSQRSN